MYIACCVAGPVARLQAALLLKTLQALHIYMASEGKPEKHNIHNNHKANTTRTNIRDRKGRERKGK